MKIKISTESFLEQTGILNIALIAQNADDEKLFEKAENSVEPIKIGEIIFGSTEDGKKEIWMSITIGNNEE